MALFKEKITLSQVMTFMWAGFSLIFFIIMHYLPEAMRTTEYYANILFFYLTIMFGLTWNFMIRLKK